MVALVTPAGMLMVPGTVTFKLLLVRVAGRPAGGEVALRFKEQLDVAGPVTVDGVQTKLVNCTDGVTVTVVVFAVPPVAGGVAVTVAV
jgi:hypothetical protein